jgi:hypothetical protein
MYQNFIVTIISEGNLNDYKFVNLKVPKSFMFSSARPDILDLLNEYCPLDDDGNVYPSNLLMTSLDNKIHFRYYFYRNNFYIRCEDLIWTLRDDGLYQTQFRVNVLPVNDLGMDNDLLLFMDDVEEFTDDVENPFYMDLTDPYYTAETSWWVDPAFMQDRKLTEEKIINFEQLEDLIDKDVVSIIATDDSINNDCTRLDFGNGYYIYILDPDNTPPPELTETSIIDVVNDPDFNIEYLIDKNVFNIKFIKSTDDNDFIEWDYVDGEVITEEGDEELDIDEFNNNPDYQPDTLNIDLLYEIINLLLSDDELISVEIIYENENPIIIDYKPIMVFKDGEIILTKELNELLDMNDVLDLDSDFGTVIQDISIKYGENEQSNFIIVVEIDESEYEIRCCNPNEYQRFSKFDQNNIFFYKKNGRGRWVKEDYKKNKAEYILDFVKMDTEKSRKIVECEQLDIHTEYKYKNSSSKNKTHYIGILDESDHMPCDFRSLIGFNVSETLSVGKDKTTIIYSNALEADKEADLVLTDEEGTYVATNNQDIGVPLEMILKYDNVDLTIIQDSVLTREWLKLGEGCGFNDNIEVDP